jgi:hypothetical protein
MHKKPAAPSVKARPMPVRPETLDHIPLERRVAMTVQDGIYQSAARARGRSISRASNGIMRAAACVIAMVQNEGMLR